uniref:Tubulin--tyrosine ligase-like protein 9 n=1 Tax=Octactis speculum TaxID=3111310 RepID=A0A7S2GH22_9STRA
MKNVIKLTLLILATTVPPKGNHSCFELFGFDIVIDEKLNPFLLEVNLSPALGNDCETDEKVKIPMMQDLIDLITPSVTPPATTPLPNKREKVAAAKRGGPAAVRQPAKSSKGPNDEKEISGSSKKEGR